MGLASKCDLHSNVDQNEERQQMHFTQAEDLAVFTVLVVCFICVNAGLPNLVETFCTYDREH